MRDVRESIHRLRQRSAQSGFTTSNVAVSVLVLLFLTSGITAAQMGERTWTDTFEDGNVDGWVGPNENVKAIESGVVGTYSFYARTDTTIGAGETSIFWQDGPTLDMDESFRISATLKQNNSADSTTLHNRIGIQQSGTLSNESGSHAFLLFDSAENITFLSTDFTEDSGTIPSNRSYPNAYENEWINVEMWSEGNSSTLNAKVWAYGSPEPDGSQLSTSFDGVNGEFVVNVGNADNIRTVLIDEITISGSEPVSENLELQTNNYRYYGERTDYTVLFDTQEAGQTVTLDVTEDANVTSLNTTLLTVDESTNEFVATDDTSVAGRVDVRASYNGSVTYNYVTVSPVAVEYLEILPPIYRFSAVLGSDTMFFLIIAMLAAVVGTRFTTAFGGISLYWTTVMIGWFSGWLSLGILLVTTVMSIFIGLNLAANIDYGAVGSVRR